MSVRDATATLRHRIEEVCREIGVLLLVFIPVDVVVTPGTPTRLAWLLILFLGGASFLGMALVSEFWRIREA